MIFTCTVSFPRNFDYSFLSQWFWKRTVPIRSISFAVGIWQRKLVSQPPAFLHRHRHIVAYEITCIMLRDRHLACIGIGIGRLSFPYFGFLRRLFAARKRCCSVRHSFLCSSFSDPLPLLRRRLGPSRARRVSALMTSLFKDLIGVLNLLYFNITCI